MISKLLVTAILIFPATDSIAPESIDSILSRRFQAESIQPVELCDDGVFLRRLSLDLIGRIPTIDELDQFLKYPDRQQKVDELLESEEFDLFLSQAWTTWLIGYSNAFGTDRELFRIWLQRQIANDVSFKKIAQQMISATGSVAVEGPANFLARHYEQPAINVCRSFLGVRLECAQCHDHPFDRWTQHDFELMSRFFNTLRREQRSGTIVLRDVLGELDEGEKPKFLTGAVPRTGSYRQELSLYVTNCKPFARNFANRVWYHLMGQGIVDPPDDFNQQNPPVDKELLEFVTSRAVENEFQIKPLFREICLSQAYQRNTATNQNSQRDVTLFAARKIKPLLAEQYLNSISVALERPIDDRRRAELTRRLVGEPRLSEDYQRTWQYRETVQQLMEKITFGVPDLDLDVDELYRRVLTREPTPRERELCQNRSSADVLYALVFGNEFFFNH